MEPRVGSERTSPAHEKGKCTEFHCAPLRAAGLERKLQEKPHLDNKAHRWAFFLLQ